jgi:predicted sulfurtransferase
MSGFVPTLKVDATPVLEHAKPTIKRPIPPVPADLDLRGKITLALFYQYVEPPWTPPQHKRALKHICELARKCGVNGRGRCAPEGLNCTLTASALGMRAFCQGLRDFDPVFENTDFKFTDDMLYEQRFKALSIKKAGELVSYGLEGDIAPSLRNGGHHLEAAEYHEMLVDTEGPPTVVIDVRNAYESAIGHFQPPPGAAELIDPKMRNSNGFPYWLALPETREKLNGKRVMMYCTGGIRCERATALLNEVTATDPSFKTLGVYECRGGIERYLKTFPSGGVWKGKNYVFDRRQVQVRTLSVAA